ncbi:MAG TPA: phosphopentomutase [Thermoleophilaceae bacterium]|nr:phosphopentomutase [Thermoleophilaceae bacterium]
MSGTRAFVVVLDGCGCGHLPDAADYGDEGAHTLRHVAEAVGGLRLPALTALGLGNVDELPGAPPADTPAIHGRLAPRGPGKDTVTGHWELMGASTPGPPVYRDGFPPEVVEAVRRATGREFIGNEMSEGLAAIERHASAHLESGALILYTSADSVFQVAAHVDLVPEPDLYEVCERARAVLTGEHAVGRVIARPFEGAPGAFSRTAGRRDYPIDPPRNHVDVLAERGVPVHGVGKVAEIMGGRGFTESHPGSDNAAAIESVERLAAGLEAGLVFANLVDTDTVHGHRKDPEGFHASLQRTDEAVARWLATMGPGDLLVLTADHGCDPAHPGSDHTREFAPLLAFREAHDGRRVEGEMACVGASAVRWLTGEDAPGLPGTPFV